VTTTADSNISTSPHKLQACPGGSSVFSPPLSKMSTKSTITPKRKSLGSAQCCLGHQAGRPSPDADVRLVRPQTRRLACPVYAEDPGLPHPRRRALLAPTYFAGDFCSIIASALQTEITGHFRICRSGNPCATALQARSYLKLRETRFALRGVNKGPGRTATESLHIMSSLLRWRRNGRRGMVIRHARNYAPKSCPRPRPVHRLIHSRCIRTAPPYPAVC